MSSALREAYLVPGTYEVRYFLPNATTWRQTSDVACADVQRFADATLEPGESAVATLVRNNCGSRPEFLLKYRIEHGKIYRIEMSQEARNAWTWAIVAIGAFLFFWGALGFPGRDGLVIAILLTVICLGFVYWNSDGKLT